MGSAPLDQQWFWLPPLLACGHPFFSPSPLGRGPVPFLAKGAHEGP
jgi:hypothetical protein